MTEQRKINEAVRSRLVEIMAAAGVPHSRISLEVLYYLPQSFLDVYAEVFERALKLSTKNGADLKEDAELGKEKTRGGRTAELKGRGAKTNGKRYKNHWVVRDDSALNLKEALDKKLRRLARELKQDLRDAEIMAAGGKVEGRCTCGRCGMILSRDWNFCPGCGEHRPIEIRESLVARDTEGKGRG